MEIVCKKTLIVGGAPERAKASAELLHERGASVAIVELPKAAGAEVALAELGYDEAAIADLGDGGVVA